MSYNGSGTYALPVPPTFPAVSGTVISSTYFNNTLNDIKDALNVVFCRDGQADATGNWNLAGFVLSGLKQDATDLALSVDGDINTGIRFPADDTGQLMAGGVGPLTWTDVGGTLAGVWTAATPTDGTDNNEIATTEFVQNSLASNGTDVQDFLASGTYTMPGNAQRVFVEVWGAGGGGGGGSSIANINTGDTGNGGSGGGGGGYASRWYDASELAATEAVTVGAGGGGGAGTVTGTNPGSAGADGGQTSFSSGAKIITAYGGIKGAGGLSNDAGGTVAVQAGGNGSQGYVQANSGIAAPQQQQFNGGLGQTSGANILSMNSWYGGGAGGAASNPVNDVTGTFGVGAAGYYGGGGGGAGGGMVGTGAFTASANGATSAVGAFSTTAAGASGSSPSPGAAGVGTSGGGGGGSRTLTGAAAGECQGGAGGVASGGGGGGSIIAGGTAGANNGGAGGSGRVRVTTWRTA